MHDDRLELDREATPIMEQPISENDFTSDDWTEPVSH